MEDDGVTESEVYEDYDNEIDGGDSDEDEEEDDEQVPKHAD